MWTHLKNADTKTMCSVTEQLAGKDVAVPEVWAAGNRRVRAACDEDGALLKESSLPGEKCERELTEQNAEAWNV